MRHTLLEYALVAFVVVTASCLAIAIILPVIDLIVGAFNVIGSALAGTK